MVSKSWLDPCIRYNIDSDPIPPVCDERIKDSITVIFKR
jgi:hypothetical protein